MKADVKSVRASLESARQYVDSTKRELAELRQRRDLLVAEIVALQARPAPWPEVVDEAVTAAVDDCAALYVPMLINWIRQKNPDLARRGSYDDLPFLGELEMSYPVAELQPAFCYFSGDRLKDQLRALLLTFDASYAADQCITRADRDAQLATLREEQRKLDGEITQLQADLDQLTKV